MEAEAGLEPDAGRSPVVVADVDGNGIDDAAGTPAATAVPDGDGEDPPARGDDALTAELPKPREPVSPVIRFLREWGLVLAIALGVAVIVRAFVFSPFYIPSGSMEPTLQVHDKILVNKLSYHAHDVRRGDVIVFDAPPNGNFGANVKDLVKRVIGLPGDTVEIRDCSVYVNSQMLVEPYIPHDGGGSPVCTDGADRVVDLDGDGRIQVPAGKVFVMGDNRNPQQSYDSRRWGFLDEHLIVGRAFLIYWPISRWSSL